MRNLGLDILRFIAVILVLGRHLKLPSDPYLPLVIWKRGGWIGVDLFFVLSGFLVSSLLFREIKKTGSANVKRFLIRRAFKIYPAFWLFLAVSVALRLLVHNPPSARSLMGELFFLQNYLGGVWNHTWSLAVEEHFYIGLAILIGWMTASRSVEGQKSLRAIPAVFAFVCIACFCFRYLTLYVVPDYSLGECLYTTHTRIDSLFFGVLLSYGFHFHDLEAKLSRIPSYVLYSIGCLLLSPAFIYPYETHKWILVGGVTLFYLGSGAILIAALRKQNSSSPLLKLFGTLGIASYSIYLWHMPVKVWGTAVVEKLTGIDHFAFYAATYLLGSLAFGWLMSRVIEVPVLLARDTFFPSKTSAPSISTEPIPSDESLRQQGEA